MHVVGQLGLWLYYISFLLPLQCEDVVSSLSPPPAILGELKPPQQQDLMAFLCLVGYRVQGGCPGPEDAVSNQKLFSTAYFLVSALAGMEKERTVVALKLLCLLLWNIWYMWFPPFQQYGEVKWKAEEAFMIAMKSPRLV